MSHKETFEGLDKASQRHESEVVIDLAPDRILHFLGVYVIILLAVVTKVTEVVGKGRLSCFPIHQNKSGLTFVNHANKYCWESSEIDLYVTEDNTSDISVCQKFKANATNLESFHPNSLAVKRFLQWMPYGMLFEAFLFALPTAYWHFEVGARLMGHLKFMQLLINDIYESVKTIPAGIYKKKPYDEDGHSLNCWRRKSKNATKKQTNQVKHHTQNPPKKMAPKRKDSHASTDESTPLCPEDGNPGTSNSGTDGKPQKDETSDGGDEETKGTTASRQQEEDHNEKELKRVLNKITEPKFVPQDHEATQPEKVSQNSDHKREASESPTNDDTSGQRQLQEENDRASDRGDGEVVKSNTESSTSDDTGHIKEQPHEKTKYETTSFFGNKPIVKKNTRERKQSELSRTAEIRRESGKAGKVFDSSEDSDSSQNTGTRIGGEKTIRDRHIFSMLCNENYASLQHQPYLKSVAKLMEVPDYENDIENMLPDEEKILPLKNAILRTFCHDENFNKSYVVKVYFKKCALSIILASLLLIGLTCLFALVLIPTMSTVSFLCEIPYHPTTCLSCTLTGLIDVYAAFFANWVAVAIYLTIAVIQTNFVRNAADHPLSNFLEEIKPLCGVALIAAHQSKEEENKNEKK